MFRYSFPGTNSARKLITELPILLAIFLGQVINTVGLSDCSRKQQPLGAERNKLHVGCETTTTTLF